MNRSKKIDADMKLSFEVTFEIFENQFYSRFAVQRAFKNCLKVLFGQKYTLLLKEE